ncbi:MAG: delta-60 repeat domain-containing protein [Verrucomicrobiae bacterium]|nr:delta-60 repeat domain-containing protein [Verrucomicrobiae bacterium]
MKSIHCGPFVPILVLGRAALILAAVAGGGALIAAPPPASPDPAFRAGLADGLNVSSVASLALQGDGKLLIAGSLKGGPDLPNPSLARLLADGRFDPAFNPPGDPMSVRAVTGLRDGRILIAGSFRITDGVNARTNRARLLADGSLDASFDAGPGPAAAHLLELDDGRILVAGTSVSTSEGVKSAIVRLHEDGRLDEEYATTPVEGQVTAIAKGIGGELYLLGTFYEPVFPVRPKLILRLREDGSLDPSFQEPDFLVGSRAMVSTPEGGVIVSSSDGMGPSGDVEIAVIRLHRDGTRDPEYRPRVLGRVTFILPDGGVPNPPSIQCMVGQPDGRLLIAGKFDRVNGIRRNNVARLNPDGSLDTTFDPGVGPVSSGDPISYLVTSALLARNGGIYLAGPFSRYNGQALAGLVRLQGDPLPRMESRRGEAGQVVAVWIGSPGESVEFLLSPDLLSWTPWTTATNETGIVAVPLPSTGVGFLRGWTR